VSSTIVPVRYELDMEMTTKVIAILSASDTAADLPWVRLSNEWT
jgi:hypothetical protein